MLYNITSTINGKKNIVVNYKPLSKIHAMSSAKALKKFKQFKNIKVVKAK